jgi:hypothetical protein
MARRGTVGIFRRAAWKLFGFVRVGIEAYAQILGGK